MESRDGETGTLSLAVPNTKKDVWEAARNSERHGQHRFGTYKRREGFCLSESKVVVQSHDFNRAAPSVVRHDFPAVPLRCGGLHVGVSLVSGEFFFFVFAFFRARDLSCLVLKGGTSKDHCLLQLER